MPAPPCTVDPSVLGPHCPPSVTLTAEQCAALEHASPVTVSPVNALALRVGVTVAARLLVDTGLRIGAARAEGNLARESALLKQAAEHAGYLTRLLTATIGDGLVGPDVSGPLVAHFLAALDEADARAMPAVWTTLPIPELEC